MYVSYVFVIVIIVLFNTLFFFMWILALLFQREAQNSRYIFFLFTNLINFSSFGFDLIWNYIYTTAV